MLKGRVAVVTGSTSGIGLGMARALAAAGCNIMMNGFGDPAEIEQLRSSMEKEFGVKALFHGADLSKGEQCAELIKTAETQFGKLDILVNNAGIQHVSPIESFPVDRWDAIIAINLSSAFHTIRAALPGMKSAGWGRLINTASTHGLVASANKVAYVAAKHGIMGLTKTAALELAGSGITCNAICPGAVLTPAIDWRLRQEMQRDGSSFADAEASFLGARQPSRRFVKDENVAGLIAFLCGQNAEDINGAALPIDGAWTAGRG